MPDINIPPGNFSGLASLAANRTGGLGLAVPRITSADTSAGSFMSGLAGGLQNLQGVLQQNKENAMKQQVIDASVAQQKQDQIDKAKEMEMKQKMFDLQLNKQAMALSKQQQIDKLQASSVASYMISQYPEDDWNKKKVGIISGMVKSGLIDQEQGKQFIEMDYPQVNAYAKATALVTGKAAGYAAIEKANQATNSPGGSTKVYDPNTGKLLMESNSSSSKPTATTMTGVQKSITDADETLSSLDQIQKNYQNDFVGAMGAGKSKTLGLRDWLSNAPIIGPMVGLSDDQKDWLKKQSDFSASSEALSLSYIKQLSGVQYSDKQLEYMKKILPQGSDSPSMFQGKMESLQNHLGQLKGLKEKILSEGIPYSSDPNSEYAQEFNHQAQLTLFGAEKTATEADIQATMDANHMSREEVLKALQDKGYTIQGGK